MTDYFCFNEANKQKKLKINSQFIVGGCVGGIADDYDEKQMCTQNPTQQFDPSFALTGLCLTAAPSLHAHYANDDDGGADGGDDDDDGNQCEHIVPWQRLPYNIYHMNACLPYQCIFSVKTMQWW